MKLKIVTENNKLFIGITFLIISAVFIILLVIFTESADIPLNLIVIAVFLFLGIYFIFTRKKDTTEIINCKSYEVVE